LLLTRQHDFPDNGYKGAKWLIKKRERERETGEVQEGKFAKEARGWLKKENAGLWSY
jgi:hypothetical protein